MLDAPLILYLPNHEQDIFVTSDYKETTTITKLERLNGEVRYREKTIRGLKKIDIPIISGYQIFHNYVRPNEGLARKTPAEVSGINVEGGK